jgi:cytolysin-activating lysine-acyltransferase
MAKNESGKPPLQAPPMPTLTVPPASTPRTDLPPELERFAQQARDQAEKVLKKIPALGPITWLMLCNSSTRHLLLSDLEWRVMPALMLDQAKLYLRGPSPVAFASWALLADAVVQRYRLAPHRLAPGDWKSGDQVWLIDVFTPFGGAQEVLKDLRENMFAGQVVHQLAPGDAQAAGVISWPAVSPPAAGKS